MKLPQAWFAVLAASSLLLAGCAEDNSEGAFAGSAMAQAVGTNTGESFATGASTGALINATTFVIAKHQATERQRRIAEERARATCQHMIAENRRREAAATAATTQPRGKKPSMAKRPPKPAKLPHYIAVDTIKDERTSPKAKKSVMLWDTQAERVIGNDVYDISSTPPVGSTARFETYSAQYVASGI